MRSTRGPQVREQVESLGATFVEMPELESGEGEGGYAKEMSPAFIAAEQALIAQHTESSDVVISTALVPGKPAPQLVTSGAVVSMQHGSVIVDLAAEQGGNCALTERDRAVEKFGVKILGFTDLASRMARQSSDLYATTVYNLLEDVLDAKAGDASRSTSRTRSTAASSSCTRASSSGRRRRARARARPPPCPEAKPRRRRRRPRAAPSRVGPLLIALVAVALLAAGLVAGGEFVEHLTVFLLACVVGWHVIWNVNPALHTPLMSVTNAISGIILVGGILLMRMGGIGAAHAPRRRRHPHRDHQRRGRVPRDLAHAADVPPMIASLASVQRLAYLAASLLFIMSLRGLSTQETRAPRQRRGHRRDGRSPSP